MVQTRRQWKDWRDRGFQSSQSSQSSQGSNQDFDWHELPNIPSQDDQFDVQVPDFVQQINDHTTPARYRPNDRCKRNRLEDGQAKTETVKPYTRRKAQK